MADPLASIDKIIILSYMAGVLIIGTYFGRYVRSAGDFFLAGRALPFWAVGMSVVVSDIGAMDIIAGAGSTYKYGMAQFNFDWLGSMPALILAAFLFIPYFWRAGVYTIPEFLGRRYNAAVQVIGAVFWLVFLSANLAIMLWVTAKMLNGVLGWPIQLGIWATVVIVGIYTVSGGLSAVVMTDVMQLVVMFVGGAAMVILALWEAGGWSGMTETVLALGDRYQNHFTLLLPHDTPTPYPWSGIVFGLGIVLSTSYFVGNQAVVQRALGARSEWDAKAGMLFAGFLKLFIPVLVFLPGLTMVALRPDLADPDDAVPTLIRSILPPGLMGLMFAAFFAALMSSVDSYLNSCTTVFTTDVYGKLHQWIRKRVPTQRHNLVLGRVLTVVLILLAGYLAPIFDNPDRPIYVIIQTMLSYFQGPTLAVLLLGIFWRRATRWGGLAGVVLGVCLTVTLSGIGDRVFPSGDPFLFVSFWSFLFSLVVTVLVSLITRPEPVEKLRGLVWGMVVHDDEMQRRLSERLARRPRDGNGADSEEAGGS